VPGIRSDSASRRLITEDDVTRLLVRLQRSGRAPKTIRSVAGTLHSLFELAVRRGCVDANPCKQIDLPLVRPSGDVRFLTHAELRPVLERAIPNDERAAVDRALNMTAAMAGLRQGELLGLRLVWPRHRGTQSSSSSRNEVADEQR
jgi:site-specific recombinase XerC